MTSPLAAVRTGAMPRAHLPPQAQQPASSTPLQPGRDTRFLHSVAFFAPHRNGDSIRALLRLRKASRVGDMFRDVRSIEHTFDKIPHPWAERILRYLSAELWGQGSMRLVASAMSGKFG
jgi:hypothetical protein